MFLRQISVFFAVALELACSSGTDTSSADSVGCGTQSSKTCPEDEDASFASNLDESNVATGAPGGANGSRGTSASQQGVAQVSENEAMAAVDSSMADSPPDGGLRQTEGAESDVGVAQMPSIGQADAEVALDGGGLSSVPSADPGVPIGRLNGTSFYGSEGVLDWDGTGNVLKQEDSFYWFSAIAGGVAVSHSTDLELWSEPEFLVSYDHDEGRPYVVHNPNTNKYVLYTNTLIPAPVAVSDRLNGDYTITGDFDPVDIGPFAPFVDEDGVGYIAVVKNTTGLDRSAKIDLFQLSEDYLSVDHKVTSFPYDTTLQEPVLFKRNGVYFLLAYLASDFFVLATTSDLTGDWEISTVSTPSFGPSSTPIFSLGSVLEVPEDPESTFLLISGFEWLPLTFLTGDLLRPNWFDKVVFDVDSGTVESSSSDVVVINQLSGLALDIADKSTDYRAPVSVSTLDGSDSQVWSLEQRQLALYRLINGASGRPLSFGYDPLVDYQAQPVTEFYHALLAETGPPLNTEETDGPYWQTFELRPGPQSGMYQLYNSTLGVYLGVEEGAGISGVAVGLFEASGPDTVWSINAVE